MLSPSAGRWGSSCGVYRLSSSRQCHSPSFFLSFLFCWTVFRSRTSTFLSNLQSDGVRISRSPFAWIKRRRCEPSVRLVWEWPRSTSDGARLSTWPRRERSRRRSGPRRASSPPLWAVDGWQRASAPTAPTDDNNVDPSRSFLPLSFFLFFFFLYY